MGVFNSKKRMKQQNDQIPETAESVEAELASDEFVESPEFQASKYQEQLESDLENLIDYFTRVEMQHLN